jgi:hypothetical protein
MSSKNKKVTYKHPIDENVDYLVPLQYPIQSRVLETISPLPIGFFESVYFPISILIYLPIPLSQLIIGLIYIGQCPIQDLIVVWMIVSGVSGILLVLIGVIIHIQVRKHSIRLSPYDDPQSYSLLIRILIPCFVIMFIFVVAWFFAGQVFIFEVKLRVEFFDSTLPEYCHGILYRAAYVLIFIDYLVFLLAIILNVLTYVAPADDPPPRNPYPHIDT